MPIRSCEEVEVLIDRHLLVHAEMVRHVAELLPDRFHIGSHIEAKDADLSGLWTQQRTDQLECGRFSGTVRADEAVESPSIDLEADAVQGAMIFEQVRDLIDFDDGRTHVLVLPGRN